MYRLNFCGIDINIKKIMKLELCFLAVLDKVYHTPYGAIGSKTKDGSIIFYFDNKMNIKVVLHGHKHVYNFNNENAADIIGCGSSIGKVDITDRDDKNYLTFNLIKVNKNTNTPEVC